MTGRGDHMDDEQFDRLLREAARGYNAPPPAPVEAMWAAIEARRASPTASADAGGSATAPTPHVIGTIGPKTFTRVPRAWRAGAAALAAVLLLSVGIAIGRQWGADAGAVSGGLADGRPRDATVTDAAPAQPAPTDVAVQPAAPAEPASRGGALPPAADVRDRAVAGGERAPAGAGRVRDVASAARGGAEGAASAAPYRVLTAQHLAQAEALLTGFRAEAPGGGGAAADAMWARDLLSTTRLLLDSPAARDPERRRLLEDLELVLAQLVLLPRADSPEERALIDRALRRGDVLTRLRSAGGLQGT